MLYDSSAKRFKARNSLVINKTFLVSQTHRYGSGYDKYCPNCQSIISQSRPTVVIHYLASTRVVFIEIVDTTGTHTMNYRYISRI